MRRSYFYYFAATLFLALLASKFSTDYGFSELAGFGADYFRPSIDAIEQLPVYKRPGSSGYDGQFYAQIAIDPTLRDPGFVDAIDFPSYRARRIALPALSFALGLGQPAAILQIHCLLNVACLALVAWLLLHWIPPVSHENFVRWFLCVFSMGALESVRYSLVDLPALGLALLTIAALENRKTAPAFLAHISAVLSKETALINALVFLGGKNIPPARRFTGAALATGAAVLPLAAWMTYVSHIFPPTLNANENIGLPVTGLVRAFFDAFEMLAPDDEWDRYFFRILALPGLTFQAVWLLLHPQTKSRLWLLGIAYTVLFLCIGDAVWRGYWAACRVCLPMTFAFNLLFTHPNKKVLWATLLLTNISLIHGIIRWL